MKDNLVKFLRDLVEAPSPSGFEQPAQEVYRNFVKDCADEITTDYHGSVIALKKGKGKRRVMLVGHADEIGLMVRYIDENGFIRFTAIGFVDHTLLQGVRVDIHHEGKVIRGVVESKAIHMYKDFERTELIKKEELWIDIGARNKAEAEEMVSVGDGITFAAGMELLPNNLVTSKALDNKVGVFTVGAVLKNLENEELNANIYSVSCVQEELGLRGSTTSAYGINPDIGIAIDVTHATDFPGADKNHWGDMKLNGGIAVAVGANINPRVLELLKAAAKKHSVPYQIEAIPGSSGTDAASVQLTRAGVATGLLSIPTRNMHAPSEVISLADLEGGVTILTEFCRMIGDDTNLIP